MTRQDRALLTKSAAEYTSPLRAVKSAVVREMDQKNEAQEEVLPEGKYLTQKTIKAIAKNYKWFAGEYKKHGKPYGYA